MRAWRGFGAAVAAMAAASAAQAATDGTSDSTVVHELVVPGRLPHEVKGLVVSPAKGCLKARKPPDPDVPPPKLVSSFPADGAVVKPGVIVLRLTFDLPMTCPGLVDADFPIRDPCPAPLTDPVISKDRRTFLTVCVVEPNARYGVALNRRATRGWTSLAGHKLAPQEIVFFTASPDRTVRTVHEAIAEDAFLRKMVGQAQGAAASASPAGPAPQVVASAAPANAAPEAVASTAASTTVAPVTVAAPVKGSDLIRSRSFIEAYAAPTARLGRYARWNTPPCVVVSGLAAAQAAAVKARVEEVAREAGLQVGGAGCKANVEIEFTDQPQALVDKIVGKTPQVLGFQPGVNRKALKAVTRPIQAWYMTASRGGADPLAKANAMAALPKPDLGAPNPGTTTSARRVPANAAAWAQAGALPIQGPAEFLDEPSRDAGCGDLRRSSCESVFWNILLVVDAGRVQDRSVASLSDYVAMLALSQPQSLDGCMSLASIIDLLAPAPCPGREPPDSLTPADKAYLTALYASDPGANPTLRQSAMSERMAAILVKAAPALATAASGGEGDGQAGH